MKQLLILSGKGGTGKTTIAGAFIRLSDAKAYADCDVDAPNLHLIMGKSSKPQRTAYYGMLKAEINPESCIQCDLCRQNCRFDAISVKTDYKVDIFACEGCGVCAAVCPTCAISLKPAVAGELMLYVDEHSVFSTAQLKMGSGTSGMLVTEVKKQMKSGATLADLAIIDGSPGIGCPVIASLSGVDMVLIVTEPSISGISDMERIIKTAQNFQTKIAVCINKYDTNIKNTDRIESFCLANGISFTGRIPFDSDAVKAINNGQTIVDIDSTSGHAAIDVYDKTMKLLFTENGGNKMNQYSERAIQLFKEGYNCSQSVVGAFCDELGMDMDTILKLSSSFGGGMGRLREVCGAVTGMFMVAGIKYGYSDPLDEKAKADHYELVQELANTFKEKNGSIICRELLNLPEGPQDPIPEKRTEKYYQVRPCAELVGYAAEMMGELIIKRNLDYKIN